MTPSCSRVAHIVAFALLTAGVAGARDVTVRPGDGSPVTNRPREVLEDGYASSGACRSCHPDQYASWFATYHRTMTQIATPASVIPDFHPMQLEAYGRSYHAERRGDEFWVQMDDPLWQGGSGAQPRVERQIVMTTGSHHQQLYWYAAGPESVVGLFPFLYLIGPKQWVPLPANFLIEPIPEGTRLPLAELVGKWNRTCINCHATRGQQRIQGPLQMDTRAAEFGIACDACHGPGEIHIRVNQDPRRRYAQHLEEGGDSSVVDPSDLSPRLGSQVCGQCHSSFTVVRNAADRARWNQRGTSYRPGDDLTHTRYLIGHNEEMKTPAMQAFHASQPTYLRDRFWSDGEIRVSGREYNGLIESACYTRGHGERKLSCMSCHTMHKSPDDPRPLEAWADSLLGAGMDGDEACLQCHTTFRTQPEKHTHHPAASQGSRCTNCHMAYTSYGLLKAIRSHRVHSPSVQESLETGRPNACNLCHQDRTLAWTADQMETWYDTPKPELSVDERTVSAMVLWALRGDAGQRALAAWSLGWRPAREASGSKWVIPYLAQLLSDPYDAVRYIAWRSLRAQPGFGDFEYDFMAAPAERNAVRQRLLRGWHRTRATANRPTGESILISSDGSLDWASFQRLFRQRNDTPVNLAE